ncbi:circadian-associated transcriptional repressor-like [Gouania willdenowi]|uniref:Circadian-associated transcriptional repressor-like n=1 Tax=Gouania willdenowi TaxID=441366 RepID=A0A8C5G8Q5_GOUWI|nr:circadian-associated transcriptional repressor-like [Gouania willdenowi]XP_028327226.1 circadian-associated transcriptional repressor-like [Gouania willdenowi]
MQSQGSTSSQPSFDSLSSSDSLLFSDSEQAEDDTDVFLTDSSSSTINGEAPRAAANGDGASESPGSQWRCEFNAKEEESSSFRSESGCRAARASLSGKDAASQIPKSQGDLLFAQKCAELQGFVRPLLELLNGLKQGRFDRGLSTFQQSVAMDRIQRIVGVLQRPNIGEKYLSTLLQVEVMLKLWFPHISTQPQSADSSTAASPARFLQDSSNTTPPHKHKDQLHIPVKKRRLSWTGSDSPTPSPILPKSSRVSSEEKNTRQLQDERTSVHFSPSLSSDANPCVADVATNSQQLMDDTKGTDGDGEEAAKFSKYKAGQSSEPSLTWVHVAPIPSPRKACLSHESMQAMQSINNVSTPSRRGSPATQDSSISSTTTNKHPKNLKKANRCQSKPVSGQPSDGETSETSQGQSHASDATLKPLSRVGPTTLET